MKTRGREYGVRRNPRGARRANPVSRHQLLKQGHFMTYVKATPSEFAPRGGTDTPPEVIYAPTLGALSRAVSAWIAEADTGATSYMEGRSGHVRDDRGHPVAYISYNGRVWEREWEAGSRRPLEITGAALDAPPAGRVPLQASRQISKRRANPEAVLWESEPLQDHDDRVTVVAIAGKVGGRARVETQPEPAADRTPRDVRPYATGTQAIAAAKSRARRLRADARRPNPSLVILNPLPQHLKDFARKQRLTADERAEFNQAIARYCEFHDVGAEEIRLERLDDVDGEGTRFLVGMGDTEDVSYSANDKRAFKASNKRGTPFRHEFPSKPIMATTPDGSMIVVVNKPGAAQRFAVSDWIRG